MPKSIYGSNFSSILLRVYLGITPRAEIANGCYFVDATDINTGLMTSHFCNHSDPTSAQMLAGEGRYVIGGFADKRDIEPESRGYEMIVSRDFLSKVKLVVLTAD